MWFAQSATLVAEICLFSLCKLAMWSARSATLLAEMEHFNAK